MPINFDQGYDPNTSKNKCVEEFEKAIKISTLASDLEKGSLGES